jgi:hypothetical protein
MPSILIIDDKLELLNELVAALNAQLVSGEVEIRVWVPRKEETDPFAAFASKIDAETLLVITDYDLTTGGNLGLFGSTIVSWCQARAIPVGDYSRANVGNLPKEPNFFELRVPSNSEAAASFIVSVFRGFREIRDKAAAKDELLRKKRSPAAVLAELLGVPRMESQFALYGVRLSTTNAALLDTIMRSAPEEREPSPDEKRSLLNYIVGHILVNAVLRFPGPILSTRALCAYVGSAEAETDTIAELFTDARYGGPFAQLDRFFWLFKVDDILHKLLADLPKEFPAETHGELHREAIELKLSRKLARHTCPRCQGVNGGFLCPFTKKTVCQRPDCSVGSNSWVPQGATLCRIERDFYEEWSPVLGL